VGQQTGEYRKPGTEGWQADEGESSRKGAGVAAGKATKVAAAVVDGWWRTMNGGGWAGIIRSR